MQQYLPQTKTKIAKLLAAYKEGDRRTAIEILCDRLPDVYVEEKYEELVQETIRSQK